VQVQANDVYLQRGLGVGASVLKRIKSDLAKMGLIKHITKRDEKGKIIGHFIKVNHVWGRGAIDKLINGNIDQKILQMAKRYIIDLYPEYEPICGVEDILLPTIYLNGAEVEVVDGYIFFDENELFHVAIEMDSDNTFSYCFSATDAPSIIMQTYENVTSQQ
jgi:hypothetical protein